MNQGAMDRIIDEHFGYEATDDVEGVLATLVPGATHHLVGSPLGPVSGHAAIRAFYEELFAALRGEAVEPVARWYGDGFLVDESLWTGEVHDGRLLGLPGRSGHATFRLLHVFELDGERIRTERVWCDLAALGEQLT
ncbi:MAG: nuclear transport factor 2 family protein [Acidimicrobiia bacterium]